MSNRFGHTRTSAWACQRKDAGVSILVTIRLQSCGGIEDHLADALSAAIGAAADLVYDKYDIRRQNHKLSPVSLKMQSPG